MSDILSLYELNQLIRSVIDTALPGAVLVTAEIASCDVKKHCYMTLVDKDGDTIRAEMKAVIWADRYRNLSARFEDATGIKFSKGIKILFQASVSFHERYGLKLVVLDIDPSYTLGEMAIRRKEIMERLAKEGLRDRNRALTFPLVPQRIGIVSSSTAAGYEDLMSHLTHNAYGYRFSCRLYEAVMQGDRAEGSIVRALNLCASQARELDVVVIVRGGGGQTDLHSFDSYELGKAIALLPLPAVSGIGHERDITVVDEVSHSRAKTPTAVADLMITAMRDFEDRIDSLANRLVHETKDLTSALKERLALLTKHLDSAIRQELLNYLHKLRILVKGLRYSLKLIQSQRQRLRSVEHNISHLDPRNVLKRGYSITYKDDSALKTAADIQTGDRLRTVLAKGEMFSKVEKKDMGVKKT